MNRTRHIFYKRHTVFPAMKTWFEYKPLYELGFNRYFRGEYKPKHHRRRSLVIRDLKRLYNYTFIELLCAEMEFDKGAFDSHHGVDYKWVKKHRVCAYHY